MLVIEDLNKGKVTLKLFKIESSPICMIICRYVQCSDCEEPAWGPTISRYPTFECENA